ncbi:hypothetical protein KEM54_005304 [Ascosphaera aggregata]|nr:hypothetical protein KEM54_005304 [Ascosphaera aggregata]
MFETGVLGKGATPGQDRHLRHVTEMDATTCRRVAARNATGLRMSAEGDDSNITREKGSKRSVRCVIMLIRSNRTPRYAPTAGVSTPSGVATPFKTRATTLDIPGLTRSKVSPDGHIASRDVGSKLVIVMVGLPARGKSYITKKLARYLNWLQHDTRIFNVGERRRSAVGVTGPSLAHGRPSKVDARLRESVADLHLNDQERQTASPTSEEGEESPHGTYGGTERHAPAVPNGSPHTLFDKFPGRLSPQRIGRQSTQILVNGAPVDNLSQDYRQLTRDPSPMTDAVNTPVSSQRPNSQTDARVEFCTTATSGYIRPEPPIIPPSPGMLEEKVQSGVVPASQCVDKIDQSANFFDPENQNAVKLREQVALTTLDELLDYILDQGGSVGIFDATNSTLSRRKAIMDRIRERAGPDLNVIFLESKCEDQTLIESNIRLKLSGPDYKGKDPAASLQDFKCRIDMYEKTYIPLGQYEEENNMPYVQTIDVSRKVVSHQVNGFLSSQVVYYLLNFNLSPRQIWISRHGESEDDVTGKIGGDSPLSENGIRYAKALSRFIAHQRAAWESYQQAKKHSTHFPPEPGDTTPPNPRNSVQRARGVRSTEEDDFTPRNFCVWSSMLQRSMQTVQYFDDEEYDVKQMRMLDEINCGNLEGMTHEQIKESHPQEYTQRKKQKLGYRYPGLGGESYLDVINRLRPVIVEVERMTDHVLLVSHRAIARVLLAYFRGLRREELAGLDVPLGVVYSIEPRPYGVDFKAYRYNPETDWFDWVPNFELRQNTF